MQKGRAVGGGKIFIQAMTATSCKHFFQLVLASTSPRRSELLAGLGCRFRVKPPRFGEMLLEKRQSAAELSRSLPIIALAKALDVARRCGPGDLIIGADTVIHFRGAVLGKPRDVEDARSILSKLSGNMHRVFTSVAVASCEGKFLLASEQTEVRFRKLSAEEIDAYIATGEPMDKAGAYGIQSLGGLFVSSITGRYDNVVGLPLNRVDELLRGFGCDLYSCRNVEKLSG